MRLKLTIAYDGRPYQGWQSQPCGNTVQDHLLRALAAVARQPVSIQGSGRTDTGVHALGQCAHFDPPPELTMNPYNWVPALNAHLPATIRVMACEEVAAEFHARFSATAKTYHYDLCTSPILPPHAAGLAWHRPRGLDPGVLADALSHFLGRHDFHAFAAYRGNEDAATDYHRHIHTATVETLETGYRMIVSGDGFLYKMVRMLAGAAVKVAQGRLPEDDLLRLLDQPPGLPFGKCNHCAPADGLYLREVCYHRPLP
jgi:tRNA pseudouridine38-40 synthase